MNRLNGALSANSGEFTMSNRDKYIGLAGLIVALFSLILYSIQKIWGVANWIMLVLGIAALVFGIFSYYKNREKSISKRSLQYGSNIVFQVVIVVAIVGLIAFLTTRRHFRSDWTENSLYSLADQTEKLLSGLEKEVKLTAFFKGSEQSAAKDLLDEYKYRTGQMEYEFVDPDEQPQIAKQYQVKKYNTVVVECGAKRETIEELSEVNLTNAIVKVTRDQDKSVYFLTGHGERGIADESQEGYKQAVEAIKKENHRVREFNLVRSQSIPDSCTVLAIVAPKSNLFPGEADSIKAYIDNGGKALILLDPDTPQSFRDLAAYYHVEVGNDMVVDGSGMGRLFGAGPGMPLVTNYDKSIAITKDFSVMTFYPYTSSVIPQSDKGGYTIKEMLKTGPNSWAETDYASREVAFNEGKDKQGPVSIATLIEKKQGDKKTTLAIFGDSDFAKNGYWRNEGNADLFLNTVNYLAEEEDQIAIRPKEVDDRRVTLTQADVGMMFYLVVVAIPLVVIIFGVVFYVKRSK